MLMVLTLKPIGNMKLSVGVKVVSMGPRAELETYSVSPCPRPMAAMWPWVHKQVERKLTIALKKQQLFDSMSAGGTVALV